MSGVSRWTLALLVLVPALSSCSPKATTGEPDSAASASVSPQTSPTTSASTATPPLLRDGLVAPGRYRQVLRFECEEGDTIGCPPNATPPSPIEFDITIPDGWESATDFRLLYPTGMGGLADARGATNDPDGAGLVVGWTNFHVGLNSDPCARDHDGHLVPDIPVGPTAGDFARAVVDHPTLDVTEPKRVKLGGFRGRYFELAGPSDISGCDDWRPWDPGFYVQGPDNHWDVWAVDVAGTRVVVVAQYFPGTPDEIVTQLGEMVESIEFRP